ncbi:hypothetical protein BZA05DRAFT_383012 [Tricharina praecox]|uniref:uncharacterized protein n=1 Tax=Tricharina praecox TaxID=43433 RepID=UPI0022205D48|nr:uncharacterized protein BZA05DRAFT_383012 [Tricharina praecox]KAI5858989.1 hypothetical protein BZA05DRAFT_383012 [Tricharina praecox]
MSPTNQPMYRPPSVCCLLALGLFRLSVFLSRLQTPESNPWVVTLQHIICIIQVQQRIPATRRQQAAETKSTKSRFSIPSFFFSFLFFPFPGFVRR